MVVSASKDGVRFSTSGDVGVANVTLRQGGQGDGSDGVSIDLKEPVTLSFALRWAAGQPAAGSMPGQADCMCA